MNKSEELIEKINSVSHGTYGDSFHDLLHKYLSNETINRNLSNKQKHTVKRYTKTDYHFINGHLRQDGNTYTGYDHKDIRRMKEVTDNPTKHTFYSYRGFRGKNPDEFKEGSTLHEKGFTSTSIHKKVANSFATGIESEPKHTLFKVHVNKGTKGSYVDPHSFSDNEGEFVIHKGTTFRVGKHEKQKSGETLVNLHIHNQED